jgi:hypothetical protein
MFRKLPSFLLLFPLVFACAPARAQFSASVLGTVTDASGAVVPNASVVLHSVDTGVDFPTVTNGSGIYRFSSVAPGSYTVVVKQKGFRESTVGVTATTGETRGVDITLRPSGVESNVTVQTVASAINPDETRVQTTISAAEIGELPLPNRDVQQLIALTPGVVGFQNESPNTGYGSSIFAGSFSPSYSANGLGSNSNLYIIDDLPVMDVHTQGSALILPNAEMIGEVALQTQTYSVENGTAASLQTAFTTKSGTNSFHGTADYSYAGAHIGAAKDPFSQTVAPFHQDLILASLGGPIVKDRTFFFGSIEKQVSEIGTAVATNPYFTPQFAKWALNAFPASGAAQGLVFAPPTRDIGGTVRYANDPAYSGLAGLCGSNQTVNQPAPYNLPYNLPCDTPVYVTGAFFNQAQPFDGLQWNVRLDQNFRGGKDRIYGMYERIDQKLGNLAERPALDAVTPSQNKYFSVNYVHIFNAKLINEVHFGNLRSINGSSLGDPRAASIPYLPILLDTAAGFQFTFPFGQTPFGAQTNKAHTYAVRDTLTYVIGRHSIRAGYQFYRADAFQDSSQIYSRPFVPFYFTDALSWISNTASASYSLYTIGASGQFTPQYYGASSRYNGVFIDDSWKVTPRLTLTLGLRYDDFGNPVPYGSTAQPFVPMFPGSGSTFQQQALSTTTHITHQAFTSAQALNVMPRAGFAYTPPGLKSTLLRGGVGLYENVLTPFQIAGNLPTQPPNRISLTGYGQVPYGDFKTTTAPFGYAYPAFPTFGIDPSGNVYSNAAKTTVYAANLNGFIPNLKPEKIINYSLGLEQQFAANLVFGLSYVGSHGYDLVYGSTGATTGANADYNLATAAPGTAENTIVRPTMEWGQINYGRNGLSSNYNEMVVTLRQHYKTLSYQANYNWSRALQYAPTVADPAQNSTYSIWNSINDPKSFYGPSSFDVTHSFSFAGAYEVPKLFSNGFANQAASQWRVSTIIIAQSGTPFTVVDPTKDYQYNGSITLDSSTGGTPGFPNYVGAKRSGFSRSQARTGIFTKSQFVDPVGTGTMAVQTTQGANTFRNLGYFTVNAGLSKGFSVPLPRRTEPAHLYLRGEAVNLLNRTNYQAFGDDVTNATSFGLATSADQKRYLQIGGRFEF